MGYIKFVIFLESDGYVTLQGIPTSDITHKTFINFMLGQRYMVSTLLGNMTEIVWDLDSSVDECSTVEKIGGQKFNSKFDCFKKNDYKLNGTKLQRIMRIELKLQDKKIGKLPRWKKY